MTKEELLERSETFLRGFFEKGLPVEDLLAGADPVDFSWIGPGEKEFFDNRDALLAWYRRAAVQKARKTGPVTALEMQCAFPEEDAAEVTARFWVSEERSRLEYRATLIYTKKQGRLLLVHVHLSAPWVRAAEREDFPSSGGASITNSSKPPKKPAAMPPRRNSPPASSASSPSSVRDTPTKRSANS